ncbi:hypothetical protein C446_00926 [Halobiforma nitratireducens JCM 10879]|uniref:Uncharacterized protein n=1 Tax=Halobiforma nitratireducens JCM 10879 TaxID=1227454 RepID=M0MQT7_9EURY|nr:hypothetical protein C446_00926 [Halobiforma nitratireducens JCM 10879]
MWGRELPADPAVRSGEGRRRHSTRLHLEETVEYDPDSERVRISRLCGSSATSAIDPDWTRSSGCTINSPGETRPSLRFDGYDWEKTPRAFAD